jgi:hypothetical protein
MDRREGEPFKAVDPKYGSVYRVHTTEEMWKMITDEHGFAYQTHPRTKGSTGFPDNILDTLYFKSTRYLGVGWKAMPSDLSSPRLGERAFKTLDDLNNLGMRKITIGEVDLFQTSATDELYSQLNVNYLKINHLPDFDHYSDLLDSLSKADGFISTGEVLLPYTSIKPGPNETIDVAADTASTFPLRLAEVVWGDGKEVHHEIIDLRSTHAFDHGHYQWKLSARHWLWARLAVWDIAGGGAFTNPIWSSH